MKEKTLEDLLQRILRSEKPLPRLEGEAKKEIEGQVEIMIRREMERYQIVLRSRFGINSPHEKLADLMGKLRVNNVTRAEQIENAAVLKLRRSEIHARERGVILSVLSTHYGWTRD